MAAEPTHPTYIPEGQPLPKPILDRRSQRVGARGLGRLLTGVGLKLFAWGLVGAQAADAANLDASASITAAGALAGTAILAKAFKLDRTAEGVLAAEQYNEGVSKGDLVRSGALPAEEANTGPSRQYKQRVAYVKNLKSAGTKIKETAHILALKGTSTLTASAFGAMAFDKPGIGGLTLAGVSWVVGHSALRSGVRTASDRNAQETFTMGYEHGMNPSVKHKPTKRTAATAGQRTQRRR